MAFEWFLTPNRSRQLVLVTKPIVAPRQGRRHRRAGSLRCSGNSPAPSCRKKQEQHTDCGKAPERCVGGPRLLGLRVGPWEAVDQPLGGVVLVRRADGCTCSRPAGRAAARATIRATRNASPADAVVTRTSSGNRSATVTNRASRIASTSPIRFATQLLHQLLRQPEHGEHRDCHRCVHDNPHQALPFRKRWL